MKELTRETKRCGLSVIAAVVALSIVAGTLIGCVTDKDSLENDIPRTDFEGNDAVLEADSRKLWYNEHGINENTAGIIEAFLTNDVDTLASLAYASEGAYESYKGMRIGEYKLTVGEDEEVLVEVDILESNNEVLTPGQHELIAVSNNCTYLTKTETYYKNFVTGSNETAQRKYAISLYANGIFEIDSERAKTDADYNSRITGAIMQRMYVWFPKKYREINEQRIKETGYYAFTAEEIAEYAKTYFGLDDFKPNEGGTKYWYTIKDGYYTHDGPFSYPLRSFTFEEEREVDGCTVVTLNVWADQSATVKSMTVEYYLTVFDGEYKLVDLVVLEDTGFSPSVGNR